MTELTEESFLDAPAERVYDIITNPNRPQPWVKETERVGVNKWKAKVEYPTLLSGSRLLDTEITLLEAMRPSKVVIMMATKKPTMISKQTYRLEPLKNKTKMMLTMEYTLPYGIYGRIMDRLILRRLNQSALKENLKRLKDAVE